MASTPASAAYISQKVEWQSIKPFGNGDTIPQTVRESENQVENNAGGYVFQVSDMVRFRRFLIIGSTGGTYYVTEKQLKLQNVEHIVTMIKDGKGMDMLKEIYNINKHNRAASINPMIFCLALLIKNDTSINKEVSFKAYQMLPQICRIPTHLFQFLNNCRDVSTKTKMPGNRRFRKSISNWYTTKAPLTLARAVTKYQRRLTWSHSDALRIGHPNPYRALKLSQLSLHETTSKSKEESGFNAHDDIFLYCCAGMDHLCYRYPELTVVEESLENESLKIKEQDKEKETMDEEIKMQVDSKEHDEEMDNKSNEEKVSNAIDVENAASPQEAIKACQLPPKKPKQKKHQLPAGYVKRRFLDIAPNHLKFLQGVEDLKSCRDEEKAVLLINQFNLVREHVPTQMLNNVKVWQTLLANMPLTAMIRNLGKMTSIGLIVEADTPDSDKICQRLRDVTSLKKARIHPLALLLALVVYRNGCGDKGKLKWKPNESVLRALEDAFYAAFINVIPSNKRFLLALDVSGSMTSPLLNTCLSCREASAAMAMITLRTEPTCEVVAFKDQLTVLPITRENSLTEVVEKVGNLAFGQTDCSLPMLWAAKNQKSFDVFVVYTDNETFVGKVHPNIALQRYRQTSGIMDAKLIVVGMTSSGFTIADPDDVNMMDVVGFDSATPMIMSDFISCGFEANVANEKTYDNDDDNDDEDDASWELVSKDE